VRHKANDHGVAYAWSKYDIALSGVV